ncbi:LacI family DNA-binding transcriptional regulator [Peteryoungia desertarenae]|uniref:LacI family DNA-binding transcriptional regulator n=1 Tax=Peteryoungia desertarenae TaxID=1813451 RepID=A0ABX6QIQ0_9HYPH|nr:substrate-binding domain-containing protein [Peteryoungia desertarenae]QLF68408.1 LacI family DNA-binding transcriptional regulator [Peteryoungia desertarenae]
MKLKEFAAQIGLSPTTVSRALSGYPEVSDATRRRVEEEAIRLGYRPNINAVRLATGRAGAIGIVMSQAGQHQFSEFMIGMAERLSKNDIDILVTPMAQDGSRDELQIYRRLAESRRVDAIVVHSPKPDDPRIALLSKLKMPFLVHGRSHTKIAHAWLDIDNEDAIRRATNHLLDLGHKQIGMLNGPTGLTFTRDRASGHRMALEQRGLGYRDDLVLHGEFTDEIGFRNAMRLLSRQDPPTAILAGSMMTALGVYRAARSLGLSVGSDLSVVAHDDVFPFLTAENMAPPLSTTRSSLRSAGGRVAELVMRLLSGSDASEIGELWPTELILRDSSRPIKEGGKE